MALSNPTDRGVKTVAFGSSATNTLTCNSFTPAAGALIGCAVYLLIDDGNAHATFSASDTFTGTGSWRQDTVVGDESTFSERVSIFTATAGGSPGSGTITITRTAGTHTQWFAAQFFEITGQNASPVGATGTNSGTGTTLTITLSGAPAASSLVIGAVSDSGDDASGCTPPTSWTELSDTFDGGGNGQELEFAYKNGSSIQAPQWTSLEGFGGGNTRGVAVEILIAATITQIVADPLKANPPGLISPAGRLTPLGDPNVRGQAVYPDQAVTATGTANPPTATVSPVPAQATATATANLPGFTIAPNGLGVATGNATGQSPTTILAPNAGSASSTATANQPFGFTVSFTPAVATATGTAQSPTPTVLVNAGIATATATANDPTVQTSGGNFTNANAGVATATATANNATNTVAPTLSAAATATATANQPVVNTTGHTNAPAGVGTATATANLPGFTVIVNAGVATATATANAPAGQLGPSPANAQAVAAAYVTSAAVLVAGVVVATAQATANNVTGFLGIVGTPKTETIVYRRPAVIKYRPR